MLGRRCCAAGMGERSWTKFAFGDSKRSLPHLFLYLSLFKENKSGKKGLYRFWTPGSLNFIEWKNEKFFIFLKHLIIFLKFYLYYLFLFLRVSFFLFLLNCFFNFILGKPNKVGNLAGFRHEKKVHEVCGILTWKSSPSLEQNTRVKLHIHEAKLCICSA